MLRLKALDHVGIIVTDMDRSLRFYTEALGMELLRRRGSGNEGSAVLRVGGTEINVFCNPQSGTAGKEAPPDDVGTAWRGGSMGAASPAAGNCAAGARASRRSMSLTRLRGLVR